jgi:subtilisin family serine protease
MSKLLFVVTALLAGCGLDPVSAVDDLPVPTRAKAPEAMWRALSAQEPRSFIVALAASAADKTMWKAHKGRLLEAAPPSERAVDRDWEELPLVQVRATTLDAALAMIDRDEVAAAYDIEYFTLSDAESFPLIDQPAAAAAGKTGDGTSVAVLDTGVNYTRAELGSCTAPGVPSTCRVAYAADVATDDNALDANGHGTNVAAIVAGVAPGAKLLALDVFNGQSASSTDIISAINWAVGHKATYNIAALNLSLGGGSATAPCTSDAMGIALGVARTAGIAPVVASGNDGLSNALSSPACAPAAISVGAVYDSNVGGISYGGCSDPTTAADKITCFSNSASFLTVLAPGALITAGGSTMAGTSQATPHVAGAIAVLRAAYPSETVDQLVGRLTTTGKKIVDARNGVTTPRIDVFAAVSATGTADTTAPTGSVAINGGAAATRTAAVTLAITGTDAGGVTQMCVTNTATCTVFEAFAATRAWTLASGDGAKTVRVFLRDRAGNTTTAATSPSATITLDATPPTNGTLTATPGNGQIALSWAGFGDAGTGIASYRVAAVASTSPPAACGDASVSAGTSTTLTVGGLVNGTTYSYRVCALDRAGNVSAGATASAAPRPESRPPVGTITINAGARYTRTLAVTLGLAATDDTRVAQMCISDATACTSFVPYATAASYAFAAGDGLRTLRVWYRDVWGNTSLPVAASITVDTTAPIGGALAATTASGKVNLSWSAALDAGSGLASYKLMAAPGTTPPAAGCATGAALYAGTATAFVHTVVARSTWSYRLCALDSVGNVSAGTTKTITAAPSSDRL